MSHKSQKYKPIDPEILGIIQKHNTNLDDAKVGVANPETILEIYRELNDNQGVVTTANIADIAKALKIPPSSAYGVASFYSMLSIDGHPGEKPAKRVLRLCDGPVCWLCGGDKVIQDAERWIIDHPGWQVERSSCLGLCDRAPAALVDEDQAGPVSFVPKLVGGWHGDRIDYTVPRTGELRVMMAGAGKINPDLLDSALGHGAYCGLANALEKTPQEVLDTVENSGLTGRGGAGFLVGRKWRFVAQAERHPKYIICNADESEPLIFKDRILIDANPHQILEGMAIAGYATGAEEAFIYIRGEYASQAQRLEKAVQQAQAAGYLGRKINGSNFSFQIHIHRGAGAYICGEETALIESLEGSRGEPRLRPPYPPARGYRGLPTLVNNVESFAAVPSIICNGVDWYRSLSTYSTPGTKMYMILGHVNKPGLFEAPFGLTLRQVIDGFADGMRPGSQFNLGLTGGAAGTIVGSSQLDIPIDYTSAAKGISLGAGAFLVCDQSVSPLSLLKQLLHFFSVESCGKCTPCRIGTRRLCNILTRMENGSVYPGDVKEILNLADVMQVSSFCGLGQSVPIPVKSAIANFPAAFSP